jgi:hypothetical protein
MFEAIPAHLCALLLPSPFLSISQFLQHELPPQLPDARRALNQGRSIAATDFGHWAQPDSEDIVNTIKSLPIPSESLLSDILASSERLEWCSVQYAHLSTSNGINQSNYPPWIIAYWVEVARLQNHVKRPWLSAEAFLRKAQNAWKTPEIRRLCDAAEVALLQLPWGGKTAAFGADNEPTHLLSCYLSNQWLRSAHITQQLELMRIDLKRTGINDCEIIPPYTFDILQQMYQAREAIPYGKDGARRNIWGLGEEVLLGRRKAIAGIVNLNGNHWAGVVVDVANLTIRFGDSLGGTGMTNVVYAVAWWLQSHTSAIFKHDALPITQQVDNFSCGVLALNAIRHAVLPDVPLIQDASTIAINQARIDMFVRVAQLNAQYVRQH